MIKNLPQNVINQCPNGRFTLCGTVSIQLCEKRQGEYRPIVCDTVEELIAECEARGFGHTSGGGQLGMFMALEPHVIG